MGVAHDTAGAREIGDTEAEKDRRVRGQIDRREYEVCVIEHGASLFMDSPCVRAPRHDEEAGAVFVGLVEATSVPQVSIAKGCNFRVGEHVTDSGKSAHVEVDTDELKIVPRQHGGGTRGMLLHHVSWRLCCGKRLSKMRTAEESATEGRRSQPRTTRAASPHVSLHNGSTWLERVFVERDGKIVAISASVELARVVRNASWRIAAWKPPQIASQQVSGAKTAELQSASQRQRQRQRLQSKRPSVDVMRNNWPLMTHK